ncbi:MAG: tRNA lysidine(34) synthetase TilS [Gallionella sp.]|nr:tRNA lysidine(34) synthetase TilS [Gallionella sp.]
MASSRKSNLAESVAARLAPLLPPHSNILVGLSGGMDSVVLLHLLHTIAPRFQWRLFALHVHHGISPNADAWAEFCTGLCTRYGVPLQVERVDITPFRDGHGIEAAARKLRHAAFLKQACDFVALAHHADDQAETLLLQLLRGAGVKGVSAMPLLKPASLQMHATVRPLLDVSRERLSEYAAQHGLAWIEDESNADVRYPRNFLRHRVLPALQERFPEYRETLARSAQHFSEAGQLMDELAQIDSLAVFDGVTLEVNALRALSPSRAKNLLRYFLHRRGAVMPQSVQLEDMLRQLCEAREDAAVCVDFGDWQVRRYQDNAYAMPALGGFDPNTVLNWSGEAELPWSALSARLVFNRSFGCGISLDKLKGAQISLRLRSGGECLRLHSNGANRSLKNILQENHIPPWRRERLPLLYCGDELVAVIGVAIHADYRANQGEEGLLVTLE